MSTQSYSSEFKEQVIREVQETQNAALVARRHQPTQSHNGPALGSDSAAAGSRLRGCRRDCGKRPGRLVLLPRPPATGQRFPCDWQVQKLAGESPVSANYPLPVG